MKRRRYILIGSPLVIAAMAVIGALVLTGLTGPETSTPSAGTPASANQRDAFFDLIQRYRHIYFDGWTTGDTSKFSTVLFNDPSETLDANSNRELNRQQTKVTDVLANVPRRPGEGQIGFLSAQLAEVLDRRQSAQLWDAAQKKAASEGRQATLDDMPDGRIPVFAPEKWVEKKVYLTQAFVNGSHATAVYVFDSPDSTLLYHVDLIQVAGSWYITNYWVTGNP